MDLSNALLGAASGLLGIGVLNASWNRWLSPKWIAVPVGWSLLLVCTHFWVRYGGPEFGPAYAALAVALLAWALVGLSAPARDPRERRAPEVVPERAPGSAALARGLLRFAVAVPLAGVASSGAGGSSQPS